MGRKRAGTGQIPNRRNDRYPSGKIWPNGEFTLGWVRKEPSDTRDPDMRSEEGAGTGPFDLRNAPNSHTAPQCLVSAGQEGVKERSRSDKYGLNGITSYGKKMVKSAGALIDKYYPHHQVTFCTVTVPTMDAVGRAECAAKWPQLVSRFLQWLGRRLEAQGLPKVIVSVSEVQPKRLRHYKEAYLHLHALWLNPPGKRGLWTVSAIEIRTWWANAFKRINLWYEGAWVNVDVRPVRGESARYLAKYVSKDKSLINETIDDVGREGIPGQWWNMTQWTRNWIKRHTRSGESAGRVVDWLVNAAFDLDDFSQFVYLYHVEFEIDGFSVNAGWRGCIRRSSYENLMQEFDKILAVL